jgi:hypothetical protein
MKFTKLPQTSFHLDQRHNKSKVLPHTTPHFCLSPLSCTYISSRLLVQFLYANYTLFCGKHFHCYLNQTHNTKIRQTKKKNVSRRANSVSYSSAAICRLNDTTHISALETWRQCNASIVLVSINIVVRWDAYDRDLQTYAMDYPTTMNDQSINKFTVHRESSLLIRPERIIEGYIGWNLVCSLSKDETTMLRL